MDEIIKDVFAAPLATIFVVAGMVFLFVAAVGKISGKVEPGEKGRVISGVFGLAFIITGLVIYSKQAPIVAMQQKSDQSKSPDTPPTPTAIEKAPGQSKPPNIEAQTRYEGVIAKVTRFEKIGELVTLELTLRNTAAESFTFDLNTFCITTPLSEAKLIDDLTANSWTPVYYGGATCGIEKTIAADGTDLVWFKFAIRNPEKRKFTLSFPLFKGPMENLVLEK